MVTTGQQDELQTPDQVSGWTGIPIETLRYYRKVGIGPASFKLAGRVRYYRRDVQAWIDAERAESLVGGPAA